MKKNSLSVLFFAFGLFLILKGIVWLAVAAFLLSAFFFFSGGFRFFVKTKWLSTFGAFGLVFVLAIALRVSFIEIYSIPSGSMEDTLIPGDKIMVNKLAYGPEMPRSPFEIPWINLFFYLNKKTRVKKDSLTWEYKRLKGFSSPKRNDVMVFRHPIFGGRDFFIVKRCVAQPGDTINIQSGVLTINHEKFPEAETIRKTYQVWPTSFAELYEKTDSLEIATNFRTARQHTENSVELMLNSNQFNQLKNEGCIDSFLIVTVPNDSTHWVYPVHKEFSWTIDDYGPIVVPQKEMTISLNHQTFLLFEQTINMLEKVEIEEIEEQYFIDGVVAKEYTFQHNYYFFMGDNRNLSNDSRYWGFVPEENIVGKTSVIMFSNNPNGFNWSRMFKLIK